MRSDGRGKIQCRGGMPTMSAMRKYPLYCAVYCTVLYCGVQWVALAVGGLCMSCGALTCRPRVLMIWSTRCMMSRRERPREDGTRREAARKRVSRGVSLAHSVSSPLT